MDIVITDWGLQAYLNLKHRRVFTPTEYKTIIRPDVELLRDDQRRDPKFQTPRFWSPVFQYGYKMKWHNVGPGQVQLRLPVAILNGSAFLCSAYVKASTHGEKRELAKFKHHVNLISSGQYKRAGLL